jgi:hypothetical protein
MDPVDPVDPVDINQDFGSFSAVAVFYENTLSGVAAYDEDNNEVCEKHLFIYTFS